MLINQVFGTRNTHQQGILRKMPNVVQSCLKNPRQEQHQVQPLLLQLQLCTLLQILSFLLEHLLVKASTKQLWGYDLIPIFQVNRNHRIHWEPLTSLRVRLTIVKDRLQQPQQQK